MALVSISVSFFFLFRQDITLLSYYCFVCVFDLNIYHSNRLFVYIYFHCEKNLFETNYSFEERYIFILLLFVNQFKICKMPTTSKNRLRKCLPNRRKLNRAKGTVTSYYFFFFLRNRLSIIFVFWFFVFSNILFGNFCYMF